MQYIISGELTFPSILFLSVFLIMATHDDEKLKSIQECLLYNSETNKFQEMKTRVGKNNDGQEFLRLSVIEDIFSLDAPLISDTHISYILDSIPLLNICHCASSQTFR